jgi:hypothetical protein
VFIEGGAGAVCIGDAGVKVYGYGTYSVEGLGDIGATAVALPVGD